MYWLITWQDPTGGVHNSLSISDTHPADWLYDYIRMTGRKSIDKKPVILNHIEITREQYQKLSSVL